MVCARSDRCQRRGEDARRGVQRGRLSWGSRHEFPLCGQRVACGRVTRRWLKTPGPVTDAPNAILLLAEARRLRRSDQRVGEGVHIAVDHEGGHGIVERLLEVSRGRRAVHDTGHQRVAWRTSPSTSCDRRRTWRGHSRCGRRWNP